MAHLLGCFEGCEECFCICHRNQENPNRCPTYRCAGLLVETGNGNLFCPECGKFYEPEQLNAAGN